MRPRAATSYAITSPLLWAAGFKSGVARFSFNGVMNWDNQLSSILSVAEGSVAKMRERLTSPGKFSKGGEDLFPTRERVPPALPPRAPLLLLRQPSSSPLGSPVQWADLAAVQSQLQIQSQAIESLALQLRDVGRERQSQQGLIQTLQEEVHRLRERERESRRGQSPGAEVKMEHLRREVDQLKAQLRRQGEDATLQQSETRESRRRYEHSCKTLEELTDSCRETTSQYSLTKREVRQIRTTVSDLKDEVRRLFLKERQPSPLLSAHTSGASAASHSRGVRVEEAESDSEDFSPTPSLAEVSSDDLSWLDDKDPAPHQKPRVRLSVQSRRSDFAGPGSDLEEGDDDEGDDRLDEDVSPDLGSDLSLDDL
ncbi:fas-binding factor 1 homolog [Pseudoliparis swirei]|uniref:fas-binding factor 1 homolog n=1 Tax=Pseudoliparis swirei TaxID=2059687 RepID=UPI0024BE5FAA|nr:fas-binding factor 1 homolog [Pseudoliparis swirei]